MMRSTEIIHILLVDDRSDFRLAFAGLLEGQSDPEVVSQAGSLAEARTMLEGIDVALIDRGLPDGDGLELMGPLREVNPGARVFVLSSTAKMVHPTDAIQAGADGGIELVDPPERVFQAIRGEGGGQAPEKTIHHSVRGRGFCELRRYGVLRSSSNPISPTLAKDVKI